MIGDFEERGRLKLRHSGISCKCSFSALPQVMTCGADLNSQAENVLFESNTNGPCKRYFVVISPSPCPLHPTAHHPMISRSVVVWTCINLTSIHPPVCLATAPPICIAQHLSVSLSFFFLFTPTYLGILLQIECPLLLFLTSCHCNSMDHETGKWAHLHLLNVDNKPTLHKSNKLTKGPYLC